MADVPQLWASLADLDELGPPPEVFQNISAAQKLRALRAASGILASYARSRYALPLSASVDDKSTGGLSVVFSGKPHEALALAVKIGEPGGSVGSAVPIMWSTDGGVSYPNTGTLDPSGVFTLGGAKLTFSGALTAGAVASISGGVDWALRQHVVNIAASQLLVNRGVDPGQGVTQELIKRFDAAMKFAEDLQSEKAKLPEGSDATPHKRETGIRFGGMKNSWDWLDPKKYKVKVW
jgi:phage gp36-like protein